MATTPRGVERARGNHAVAASAERSIVLAIRRSGRVELAVRALAALEGSSIRSPRKLDQVREGWDASRRFLSTVLTQLAQGGLLGSGRGQHGGYWLARPLDQITLLEVFAALGPEPLTTTTPTPGAGVDPVDTAGPSGPATSGSGLWELVDRRFCDTLASLSVADVLPTLPAPAASPAPT